MRFFHLKNLLEQFYLKLLTNNMLTTVDIKCHVTLAKTWQWLINLFVYMLQKTHFHCVSLQESCFFVCLVFFCGCSK